MNMLNFSALVFSSNAESGSMSPAFVIIFAIILVIFFYSFLINKKNKNGDKNKNIKRKAYINLNSKQSFQILEYNAKEYALIVSSDSSILIDKNEIKNKNIKLIKKQNERLING